MFSLRVRPLRPADFPAVLHLLAQDQALFTPAGWRALGEDLPDLLARRRLKGHAIEDTDTGRLCFAGILGFVPAGHVERLLARGVDRLRQAILAEPQHLLAGPRLGEANAAGELELMHLFGCAAETSLAGSSRADQLRRLGLESFISSAAGYRVRHFWQETVLAEMARFVASTGAKLVRERPLTAGAVASVFRFSPQDEPPESGNPLLLLTQFPEPGFGFTPAQQHLLELALLDYSDSGAASELNLTQAAIRKRWRSIYQRVRAVAPRLAPDGPDGRRLLLAHLRQNMQELRPWRS